MNFTVEHLEFYLLVLIRVSAFILAAPFFSYQTVPRRVKAVLSIMLAIFIIQIIPVEKVSYTGVLGFSSLVIQEAAVGMMLGFMCNFAMYIVSFAGNLMDMEMGLSMASMFDPSTRIQVTVSGSIYNYLVMLVLMATNMHYVVIRAITDAFKYFSIGKAVFNGNLASMTIEFITNYFIVGFRIVLPVFACMLVINVVLGVLTRAAPQMNMFVVGMQLKVLAGIVVLMIVLNTIPTVANFIMEQMKSIIVDMYKYFTPTR